MNYHNITYPDMNNGDGLRVVLWSSGCSHHCNQCQNPQTWNPESGIKFDINAEEELFRELSRDYISGLTLSGGDPLNENNLSGILNILCKFRKIFGDTKTVWLYSGYTYEECNPKEKYDSGNTFGMLRKEILKYVDVMVDGRFEEDKKDLKLKFRGSSNQRLIDVKKSVKDNKTVLFE